MLLSEGQLGFQMSEELMSQWDSAPLGKICEQTFSCLGLSVAECRPATSFYFRLDDYCDSSHSNYCHFNNSNCVLH